ncbi:MAG: hypothetical protein ACREVW_06405 [Burkholderiales bacterium]
MKFFSKKTRGFYASDIHGARRMQIIDPVWVRPTTTVVLQTGESYIVGTQLMTNTGDEPMSLSNVPDMSTEPPTIEINNPDCKIPADAVEITDEEHATLLEGQSLGKRIVPDESGRPVLADPPAPTLEALKTSAQTTIDSYFEELYQHSVANTAIGKEYDAAYIVAKEWLKDTTKPAPERVKALAESYGVDNLGAAQVVVTKWTEAQAVAFDLRGAARLRAKLAIRQAVDAAGVEAAEQAGRLAMEQVAFTV